MRTTRTRITVASVALLAALLPWALRAQSAAVSRLTYPDTRKVTVVDDYFGTKVADPYRWLEDDRAPDVAAWVTAENKVTSAYLGTIAYRQPLAKRLETLLNYPKFGIPTRRGATFFFSLPAVEQSASDTSAILVQTGKPTA